MDDNGATPGTVDAEVRWVTTPVGLGLKRALPGARAGRRLAVPALGEAAVIGLRLSALEPDTRVEVAGVHFASTEALAAIRDFLEERLSGRGAGPRAGDVVLAGAGEAPDEVLPFVTCASTALPQTSEEFAHPDVSGSGLAAAFAYAGGWPEAVSVDSGGGLRPSPAVRDFFGGLRRSRGADHSLAALLGIRADGVPMEVLSAALSCDYEEVFRRLQALEVLGLLGWDGPRVALGAPVLRDAVFPTEADRRRVAAAFVEHASAASPVAAGVAALEAGIPLPAALRAPVVEALRAAEERRDADRWDGQAHLFAGSGDAELRELGMLSRARLALYRGKGEEAAAIVAATGSGPGEGRGEIPVPLARAILEMSGLHQRQLLEADGLGLSGLVPGAEEPDVDEVSLRGWLLAATGHRTEAVDAIRSVPSGAGAAGLVQAMTRALCGDPAGARGLLRRASGAEPFASLMETVVAGCEGRFEEGVRLYTRLVGDDWSTPPSPLHGAVALFLASGSDVDVTARLLADADAMSPAQFGSTIQNAGLARAESVTGGRERAGTLFHELVDDARRSGLLGLLSVFMTEVLEAAAVGGWLADVTAIEDVELLAPHLALARALERRSVADGEDALRLFAPSSYHHARGLSLVGRLAGEEGDHDRARRHLGRALAVFEALGAPVDAAATRIRLARAAAAEARARPVSLDGLGERRRAVAALVAAGRTNTTVAAELGISESTVKREVRALCGRFAVEDRPELVALLSATSPGAGGG